MTSTVTVTAHCADDKRVSMLLLEPGNVISAVLLSNGQSFESVVYDQRFIRVSEVHESVADEQIKIPFKFELGAEVTIKSSGETGVVQGRAEYVGDENQYFVHYKNAAGVAVNTWWVESLLSY